MYGWMDWEVEVGWGGRDGWMDRCIDGWMNGWMDGWVDVY